MSEPDKQPAAGPPRVVHVVEDDAAAQKATARLLRAAGYTVRTYGSAAEFLAGRPDATPGCIVLDVRLPGPSGLDLQRTLAESGEPMPVVFLTAHGEVPDSVRAMKSGAVDFLDKAVPGSILLEAVSRALARDAEERAHRDRQRLLRERYERLTPREREVLAHLISGQLNKQIGFDLGISERTIKIHRYRVLAKMEAESMIELARIAGELGVAAAGSVR
jgi:FixJ family two-component response regulator